MSLTCTSLFPRHKEVTTQENNVLHIFLVWMCWPLLCVQGYLSWVIDVVVLCSQQIICPELSCRRYIYFTFQTCNLQSHPMWTQVSPLRTCVRLHKAPSADSKGLLIQSLRIFSAPLNRKPNVIFILTNTNIMYLNICMWVKNKFPNLKGTKQKKSLRHWLKCCTNTLSSRSCSCWAITRRTDSRLVTLWCSSSSRTTPSQQWSRALSRTRASCWSWLWTGTGSTWWQLTCFRDLNISAFFTWQEMTSHAYWTTPSVVYRWAIVALLLVADLINNDYYNDYN